MLKEIDLLYGMITINAMIISTIVRFKSKLVIPLFTGDTETDEAKSSTVADGRGISRGEKSHLIVWQVQLPLKKGDSIFLPEDIVR